MYFYIAVMVGSWLLLVISWAFFRKPGVVLWAVGHTVFIAGWILGFTGMIR
jgi:hypothetical protein